MNASSPRSVPLLAGLLLLCTLPWACGSSGGSGGSSGPEFDVDVAFTFPERDVAEDVPQIAVTLTLSEASGDDVMVNFASIAAPFGTPPATANLDFQVLSPSPATIPAGTTSTTVFVSISDDPTGERDEAFVLRIFSASNANVGAIRDHLVTILDNDAVPFTETEPNDPAMSADDVGPIEPGIAYVVSGMIGGGAEVDYFRFTPNVDTDVFVEVVPISAGGDLVLTITDVTGGVDLLGPIDQNGEGESESLVFAAIAGEVFLVEVFNTFTAVNYRMSVVGLDPVSPLGATAVPVARRRTWLLDRESGETFVLDETLTVSDE